MLICKNNNELLEILENNCFKKVNIKLENESAILKVNTAGELSFKKKQYCITEVWKLTDYNNYIENIKIFLGFSSNNLLELTK